jgi:uncharacterized membrane protein
MGLYQKSLQYRKSSQRKKEKQKKKEIRQAIQAHNKKQRKKTLQKLKYIWIDIYKSIAILLLSILITFFSIIAFALIMIHYGYTDIAMYIAQVLKIFIDVLVHIFS